VRDTMGRRRRCTHSILPRKGKIHTREQGSRKRQGPYSPGGGTTAHSVLTSHQQPARPRWTWRTCAPPRSTWWPPVLPTQTGCASTVAAPEATPRWRAWRSPTSSRRALACTGASSSPRTAAIARCSLRPSRHADEGVNVKVHPIHLPLRALRKLFVVPVGALPVPVSNGACIGPLSPIFPG
jgi:hypothetical protein